MKREIREVNERGWICVTTDDQRFYARQVSKDGTENNKRWDFVPSITWIANCYPKDQRFIRYVANTGYNESEAIKTAAGERGSKVHAAIARLIAGGDVKLDEKFENPTTLEMEELTAEEFFYVMTFHDWCREEKPEFLASERTVWNEKYRYAGTLDILCRMKSTNYRVVHLIDVKTSKQIHIPMELQVSALKHSDEIRAAHPDCRIGILQVGYTLNKYKKFKYTPIRSQFTTFLAARRIWAREYRDAKPFQREYPVSLSLNGLVKESKQANG